MNGDKRALEMGLRYADHQWEDPVGEPGKAVRPAWACSNVLKSCVLEVLAILIEVLQFAYCSFSSVVNLLISASIKQANEECI